MNEIVLIMILVGAVLNIENIQAFQFSFSRPSTAAFLISLPVILNYKDNPLIYPFILDNFTCGLAMELMLLDFNPVGGVIIPNGVIGITVTSLIVGRGYSMPMAFFSGLLCAYLYSKVDFFMRTQRNNWNFIAEKEIISGKVKPEKWIFFSIGEEFLVSIAFLVIAFYFLEFVLKFLSQYKYVIQSFDTAFYSVVFVGLVSLFFRLRMQVQKDD